jgi:hypothetical protein
MITLYMSLLFKPSSGEAPMNNREDKPLVFQINSSSLEQLEATFVNKVVDLIPGNKKSQFPEILLECDDKLFTQIFDLANMMPELFEFQSKFLKDQEVLESPILSSYPNVRFDVPNRNRFQAPAHCDEWISFFKDVVVVWIPLFCDGYIDVCHETGEHQVERDCYWGVKLSEPDRYKWIKTLVKRGEALIFPSWLLHRSSNYFGDLGFRISVQFRLRDLKNAHSLKRTTTQKITTEVEGLQEELITKGIYEN